jgi:atypical dual specificity phosphatase
MIDSVLSLRDYGVSIGDKIILSSVTFNVPEKGVTVLLGPSGTGKSTLMRTLAGFNDGNPKLNTWGRATYVGKKLGGENRPSMVMQSAKLMISSVFENVASGLPERFNLTQAQQKDVVCRLMEHAGIGELINDLDQSVVRLPLHQQRHIAILRLAASNPKAIFIDEPTFGLEEKEAKKLLKYIKIESDRRAIMVVLHNQQEALYLDGVSMLMAGGWVQEMSDTKTFFESPKSVAAIDFVRNGTCTAPSPGAKPEEIDPDYPIKQAPVPARARKFKSDVFGPRGFLWLKKGLIAGTPRPGIVADLEDDLEALSRVGITYLITLTETKPVDAKILKKYGLGNSWVPFKDMGAPTIEEAVSLCELINELNQEGHAVAVHCKAGLGRTGTILASHLIWNGQGGVEALENVRRVEPRWVQSEEQVAFLEEFANYVANKKEVARAVCN